MLFIIGIGLNNYKDISLRSLEILKMADKVYQECYTCIQLSSFNELERVIDKSIVLADRKLVEETNKIVEEAKNFNVAFLVAGTPFFATTHTDLYLRAKERGVQVKVVHNVSILNVKGCYGLYSYSFGKTISIPYFTEKVKPISFYDSIYSNYTSNLHTLCLLDIKTDENRYMTVNEALEQLLYAEEQTQKGILNLKTKVFAVCRFATDEEFVCYDSVEKLQQMNFGKPLHSLIIPAKLSCIEEEFVSELFKE
ncbi:diphthine synthase [Vittaforma corneae ATCC 50505]|uniref:diphthine methyl ester synthase n=1 Tax=Vittaforma corneae (strain ATCC 50505) TaxID=993615 RepID=L2GKF3_VITCO|nr:diphthine synthase [Vittaforma corneae ATCC 50505]ELA40990.1 diphthine synthase [Vittaforma corneae ATCC 50505]